MTLSPEHAASLAAISPAIVEARGYRTVTDDLELFNLGFKRHPLVPTLVMPLYDALGKNGRFQHRPDEPRRDNKKRVVKYESQDGKRPIIDVHPAITDKMADATVDLWVTEGVKKGDAAVSRNLCCVSLLGVWSHRLPDWKFIELAGRRVYICFDSDVMTKDDVRGALTALASKLSDWGAVVRYVYLPAREDGGKVGLDDYFAAGGTVDDLYTRAETALRDGPPPPQFPGTEIGFRDRFLHQHHEKIRYSEDDGWHLWNGVCWRVVNPRRLMPLSEQTAQTVLEEAGRTVDEGRRADLLKQYGKLTTKKVLAGMIDMSEYQDEVYGKYPILTENGVFDAEPWFLNALNGTIDLRTGEMHDHDPADLITQCAPVIYDPKARSADWERYLDLVFPDPEIRAFIQRLAGYLIIGETTEEILPVIYGKSGTGKGTFFEGMMCALGERGYVETAQYTSLLDGGHSPGSPRSDIMKLRHARLVLTSEFPAKKHLALDLIKNLTGGDRISAREMYSKEDTLLLRFTILIAANNEPQVPTADDGMWRRLVKIAVPDRTGAVDYTLKASIKNRERNGEGILAWLVVGAMAYYRDGLAIPARIKADTDEYRLHQSPLFEFVTTCCERAEGLRQDFTALHMAYEDYAQANGGERLSQIAFAKQLAALGHPSKSDGQKYREGIALKTDAFDAFRGVLGKPLREGDTIGSSGKNDQNASVASAVVAPPSPTPYEYVTDPAAVAPILTRLSTIPSLPLDIETTGLSPRKDRVRLVSVHDGEKAYLFDMNYIKMDALLPLIYAREVVGHNLAFEFGFLPPGRSTTAWDTMLATQVLDAGLFTPRGHFTLQSVATRFSGSSLDKGEQKSDWSGALTPEQLAYAASDVTHLLAIKQTQTQDLIQAGLMPTAQLEMRALMGISWMARTGVPFDLDAWMVYGKEKANEQAVVLEQLKEYADINWASPKQVTDYFLSVGVRLESTAESTLSALHLPVADLLLRHRGLAKSTGTYGENWAGYIDDGRIHAGWKQAFTATGRMSCSEPNLQNLPRDPRVRACFRAGDGNVLVKADFSQIEARIAAQTSGDERLKAVFSSGDDVYVTIARDLLKKQTITPAERQIAKSAVLGLMFGLGNDRFVEYAQNNYGVDMDAADLQLIRHNFFRTYSRLRQWQHEQGDESVTETRTVLGRRRLFDRKNFSERLNAPIQGTAADGLKHDLALLWERGGEDGLYAPVLAVHDEIVVETAEENAEEVKALLEGCMKEGMEAYLTDVPVVTEVTIGRSWGGE